MEHIVQFAIGIDDDAIKKRVIEGPYYNPSRNWERIIGEALRGYFDENKNMIIELASSKLAESYRRTKTFKEKMTSAIEEK